MMHQYIREQADALAQKRLEEHQQPQEWEGYKIPRQVLSYQGPFFRGGGPDESGTKKLVRGRLRKRPKTREYPLSQE